MDNRNIILIFAPHKNTNTMENLVLQALGTSEVEKINKIKKNKEFLQESCKKFKNKIALGLDAKNEHLSVSGWKENLNIKTLDYLKEVHDFGISRIIYTDINKDGMKTSPNFGETKGPLTRTHPK